MAGGYCMNGQTIRTFLSANGAEGFMSLYPRFFDGIDQYIIKGGPGTGKSSMLKSVAKESIHNGYFTEYVYCSSDSDSLDGVYIDALKTAICDGTAPHTADPKYPGACGEIINISECWNSKELKKSKSDIIQLNKTISACYEKAYRYLKAAACVYEDKRHLVQKYIYTNKIDSFCKNFIKKHLQDKNFEQKTGNVFDRFLSSFTPQGFVTFKDTIYTMADNVYVLKDKYDISPMIIKTISDACIHNGYNIYRFYDPMAKNRILHLTIPQLNIALVTGNKKTNFIPQNTRAIKTDRFINDEVAEISNKLNYADKIISMAEKQALDNIKYAKQLHDDLEDIYISSMDFDKVGRMTALAMTKIFIK